MRNELKSEDRIRRAFDELFGGDALRAEDVLNEVVRVDNYTGLVTIEDIALQSLLRASLLAVLLGTASVTSPRNHHRPREDRPAVDDVHARRLQIQETMTKDIADDLHAVPRKGRSCGRDEGQTFMHVQPRAEGSWGSRRSSATDLAL